jgi:hypothetical protein
VQDAGNRIAKFTAATTDDAKVVEEIYLSVLNRFPTTAETATGVEAIRGAAGDHAQLKDDAARKADAFATYQGTLDAKQAQWEKGLLNQKPTQWDVLKPTKLAAKNGDKGGTFKLNDDGSILVGGPIEANEQYTAALDVKVKEPITAIRLEVLKDDSLPAKGPGRAAGNGNFVLNEFALTTRPSDKPREKPKPVKFQKAKATFEQGGFPIANAIDTNLASGWAIDGGTATDQAALFELPPLDTSKGVYLAFAMDQRYGSNHTIGKFRLSYTTQKNPRLTTTVTPELAKMLDTPAAERDNALTNKLRTMYLAQDQEYARLKAEAAKVPPSDPRVLGAQDLTWALLNNPAFLFNR